MTVTIDDLIIRAERWAAFQLDIRTAAERVGDVLTVDRCDEEIATTEATLATLRAL